LLSLRLNSTMVSGVDLRVSKACGPSYNKVRISAITQSSYPPKSTVPWQYSKQFQWKWTQYYLHSSLIDIIPGTPYMLQVGGETTKIEIPQKGRATGGILFADILTHWGNGLTYQVRERSAKFLNLVMGDSSMHWWYIIGDNFYDNSGWITKQYFDLLNIDAKRKVSGAVMGNHDYWINGSPQNGDESDSLGIGHTQWYATDSAWSLVGDGGKTPFDWSKDPRGQSKSHFPPMNPTNNIWWNTMGNIGMLAYSGAFGWDTYASYFDQACNQFTNDNVAHVLVLTHWSVGGLGCQNGMTAHDALVHLKQLPSCSAVKDKMHYVDGHTHCNQIMGSDGWMIGGNGYPSDCQQFGHLYIKTTNSGHMEVWYFHFADKSNSNRFDATYSCIQQYGINGCLKSPYAQKWYSSGDGPKPTPTPGGECCCYQGKCISDPWCNQSKDHCLGPCNNPADKTWCNGDAVFAS